MLLFYLGIVGTSLVAQGLKAIAAFVEDPSPIRIIHKSADNH